MRVAYEAVDIRGVERDKRGTDAQWRWWSSSVRVLMNRRGARAREEKKEERGNGAGPTMT